MKYINNVRHYLPFLEKEISIDLQRRNLIIIGPNGSGKTTLVSDLYVRAKIWIFENGPYKKIELARMRDMHADSAVQYTQQSDPATAANQQDAADRYEKQLAELNSNPIIDFFDENDLIKKAKDGFGVVEFFEATRQAKINEAKGADTTQYNLSDLRNKPETIGGDFEKHLVNLWTRRSFALTENKNLTLASEIENWFRKLNDDLRYLFEDGSLELQFNPDKYRFFIQQDNRRPYGFQTLSSGYSAILAIISRLLMRAEYLKTLPANLVGVVFIDEIDAHLHVSLQRKIFPFLTRTFPNLQFIATTHSPFVLSSVSDAVIFDIGTNEQAIDFSNYSYEMLLDSLFKVPVTSELYNSKILALSDEINKENPDAEAIRKILKSVGDAFETTDDESGYYINKARLILAKSDQVR